MHLTVSPWVTHDNCSFRHISGHDPEDIRYRVALVEKTPRIRIRSAHFREERGRYEDGEEYLNYRWPEHLDWCYGLKGDGPNDKGSKVWCDHMLTLLGYTLEN